MLASIAGIVWLRTHKNRGGERVLGMLVRVPADRDHFDRCIVIKLRSAIVITSIGHRDQRDHRIVITSIGIVISGITAS